MAAGDERLTNASAAAAGPAPGAVAVEAAAPFRAGGLVRLASLVRLEDWLLAGTLAIAAPLLAGSPARGPFDSGRPLDGALSLGAVLAALACVAARRPAARTVPPVAGGDEAPVSIVFPSQPDEPASILGRAAVGPFTGGLLAVAIAGGTALDLPSWGVSAYCVLALAVMLGVRLFLPPLSIGIRRALVTPFVLVAGGLFWSAIRAVFGSAPVAGRLTIADVQVLVTSPVFEFLVAFSAVYYAMLVYAPRQVAEREGGPLAWIVRYVLFLCGVCLGVGWLGALGS